MELSQINKSYKNNLSLQTIEPPNANPAPVENKKNGAKKIALALGGLAAVAAAGVAIYKHKKPVNITKTPDLSGISTPLAPKVPNPEDIAETPIKALQKTFLNSAGENVDGVSLQKGKALLEDGSGFTGTMTTLNKKGENISLTYKDGFIQSSSINGELYKEYLPLQFKSNHFDYIDDLKDFSRGDYSRDKGEFVRPVFDPWSIGIKRRQTSPAAICRGDDGKAQRVVKFNSDVTAFDFENGKLTAKSELKGHREYECLMHLKSGEIYDKNGNVIKRIESSEQHGYKFTDLSPEGKILKQIEGIPDDFDVATTPLKDVKPYTTAVSHQYSDGNYAGKIYAEGLHIDGDTKYEGSPGYTHDFGFIQGCHTGGSNTIEPPPANWQEYWFKDGNLKNTTALHAKNDVSNYDTIISFTNPEKSDLLIESIYNSPESKKIENIIILSIKDGKISAEELKEEGLKEGLKEGQAGEIKERVQKVMEAAKSDGIAFEYDKANELAEKIFSHVK